ncbi:hypothetical protein BDW22DRAFT_846697 [Trametopsis cervina]|nr:hypothetical protein BDW22DRAFT_846697 [Trametopsis cervina]
MKCCKCHPRIRDITQPHRNLCARGTFNRTGYATPDCLEFDDGVLIRGRSPRNRKVGMTSSLHARMHWLSYMQAREMPNSRSEASTQKTERASGRRRYEAPSVDVNGARVKRRLPDATVRAVRGRHTVAASRACQSSVNERKLTRQPAVAVNRPASRTLMPIEVEDDDGDAAAGSLGCGWGAQNVK